MDKKLYSIGKTAKLMGIQPQLLRHYCDIGLITPEYIDPCSGYRYFSFEQFHLIDRTRFLLRCGLGLKDIKRVLQSNDIPLLVKLLNQERSKKEAELKETQYCIDTIEWYINYFAYNIGESDSPYQIKSFEKRYLFAVKCPENYRPTDLYDLLHQVKNQEQYRSLKLTRQFTVIIDYDALLLKQELKRYYVGIFAMEPPTIKSKHILEIPAGEYFCFRTNSWDPKQIRVPLAGREKPSLVLASEYESSFSSCNDSPHEFQLFFDNDVSPIK